MRIRRFLHPSKVVLALAAFAALVGGFLLATAVFGQSSPSGPQLSIPLDPPPSEFAQLAPGDPEFAVFPTQFKDFPLYWVGEEFGGYPLRFIIRQVSSPGGDNQTENRVHFVYGSCGAENLSEGGCAAPLQIIVQPYCLVTPELVGNGTRPTNMVKVRGGADAVNSGGGLRIWTGNVTIKIYGWSPQLREDAAVAMVSSNGLGVAGAGAPLPAPDADCSGYRNVPLHRG